MKQSKSLSIIVSLLAYVFATLLAYFVFMHFNTMPWIWRLALANGAATLFIFIGSVLLNNSSLYDPFWSVQPMVIAFAYMVTIGFENANALQWVTFVLVQLYGIRLTSNFYRDWPGFIHEDWRYVNFREQFPRTYWLVSLGGIHFFPTVMVFLACLPLYSIFFQTPELGAIGTVVSYLGCAVLLVAIVLAYVADEQMRTFRKNPANKGKFMDQQLWRKSRHPNYLGEMLTWWGLYIIALGISINTWSTGIGALAITLMFFFVSIPLLDERSLKRRSGFDEYMKRTNKLLPF